MNDARFSVLNSSIERVGARNLYYFMATPA